MIRISGSILALTVALTVIGGCVAVSTNGDCCQTSPTDSDDGGDGEHATCTLYGSVSGGTFSQVDCNVGPTVPISGGSYGCTVTVGTNTWIKPLPNGNTKACSCQSGSVRCDYP